MPFMQLSIQNSVTQPYEESQFLRSFPLVSLRSLY